jgi:MFS family permease
MIGPAVAGLVVAASGIRTVLLVNSGLFWVMAITLASAKGLPGAAAEFGSVRERLRAAASQAWRRPPIRSLLSLQAAAILVFTISIPVEVVFAQHSLHVGAGGYGALLSVWGAGAVVGSVFYARWRRLSTRALITGSAGSLGVGFLLMAVAPSLFMALAGAALGGAGNGVEAVAERTALQEQVEPGWMALMMSINDSIFQIAPGGGIMLGGALTALSNPRVALAVAAGGALAVMGAAWIVLGPQRPAARERVASDPQRSRGTPEPATRR